MARQEVINEMRAMLDWLEHNPHVDLPDSFGSCSRRVEPNEFDREAFAMGINEGWDSADRVYGAVRFGGSVEYRLWSYKPREHTPSMGVKQAEGVGHG